MGPLWRLLAASLSLLIASPAATATGAGEAIAYLEGLKGRLTPYLAPSEIDPRFTTALYVNVATKGPVKQRMWVLHRDGPDAPWRLGMWDRDYWKKQKLAENETPPFSWLISSGRHYRGDRKSGPTPTGIYGLDERRWRYGHGWLQDGMVHVMHIDYHYGDGRASGVALHGTPAGNYRRLGTNESHGCIRMHQKNALALIDRMTGKDNGLSEPQRWGEVPRYWKSEKGRARFGYVRDGKPLTAPLAENDPTLSNDPSLKSDAPPATSDALTKTGFRAIVVIFQD